MINISTFIQTNRRYISGVITGAVSIAISYYYIRRYANGPRCQSKIMLDGKVVIVTGANTGIGKETAIDMAKRNATVILACRNQETGLKAVCEIRELSKNPNVFLKHLDLASLESIKSFCKSFLEEHDRLDILINNAGLMMCPYMKTKDGFEMQFGTNHLGPFALTNRLLPMISKSAPSRIINLSSTAHFRAKGINFDDLMSEKSYSRRGAYAQSKLANILFTRELSRKLQVYSGISVYAVHPGIVSTNLTKNSWLAALFYFLFQWGVKTPEYGAQTSIHCAVQEHLEEQNGGYFADCNVKDPSKAAQNEEAAKKLWEVSEQLTGVKYDAKLYL